MSVVHVKRLFDSRTTAHTHRETNITLAGDLILVLVVRAVYRCFLAFAYGGCSAVDSLVVYDGREIRELYLLLCLYYRSLSVLQTLYVRLCVFFILTTAGLHI